MQLTRRGRVSMPSAPRPSLHGRAFFWAETGRLPAGPPPWKVRSEADTSPPKLSRVLPDSKSQDSCHLIFRQPASCAYFHDGLRSAHDTVFVALKRPLKFQNI